MARRCRACCGAGGWPGGAAAGGPKPVVPPRAGWGEVGGTRRCQEPDLAPTLVRPPPLRRAAGHVAAARGRLPCGDARHLSAGSPPGSDARAGAATGQPDRPPGSGRGPVSAVFSPPLPPSSASCACLSEAPALLPLGVLRHLRHCRGHRLPLPARPPRHVKKEMEILRQFRITLRPQVGAADAQVSFGSALIRS